MECCSSTVEPVASKSEASFSAILVAAEAAVVRVKEIVVEQQATPTEI